MKNRTITLLFWHLLLLGTLAISSRAALLQGTLSPISPGTNIDLTAEGVLDWAHWGSVDTNSFDHKVGVVQQISNISLVNTDTFQAYATAAQGYSWTNGTPTIGATNSTTGLSLTGTNSGFRLTIPAGLIAKELKLYVGANKARGNVLVTLNDASAPSYSDNSLDSTDVTNGVYLFRFAAAGSNQTLTVQYSVADLYDPFGFITLESASLSTNSANVAPSVSLLSPTNGTRYYAPAKISMTASASDIDGVIRKVAFYQNASLIGQATNPPYTLTWSNVADSSYALTAVATDNAGATNVSSAVNVTVVTNIPPTISISSPADEAEFVVPVAVPINTTANDVDGFVQKVEFFQGTTKIGEVTNAPFNFTWNGAAPGLYTLTARVTDDAGAAVDSNPISVFVTTTGGALAGSGATPASTVNLTSEGAADWIHWGLFTETSVDRKAGVSAQISDYSIIGPDGPYQYGDNLNGYGWSDGTPTTVVSNTTTGIYMTGLKNGFVLTVPADPSPRTLKLYLGAYGARGKLKCYLSDFTAPVFTDTSINYTGNGPSQVFTLTYSSASVGQTLNVRYTIDAMNDLLYGNVTLQAAALTTSNALPTVSITSPTNTSSFIGPTNITITAAAADSDGTISRVEFYNGAVKLGQATSSPFTYTWNNVTNGNYTLTAKATDNVGSVVTSSSVSVFVGIGGGILNGQFSSPPHTNNLTTDGPVDWIHWGLQTVNSVNRKNITPARLGSLTISGTPNQRGQYGDSAVTITWNDGTPTGAAISTTGIYVMGLSNGFQLTGPADPTRRRLKVYVGLYGARGKFQASLNDFSAAPYSDNSLLNVGNNAVGLYTLDYAAASSNKTLTVQYSSSVLYDGTYGNVTIQAATLAFTPPPAPRLLSFSPNGNNFVYSFFGERGFTYFAEKTDSLSPTNWQVLQTFPGSGATLSFTNTNALSFSNRFYRLRVQ